MTNKNRRPTELQPVLIGHKAGTKRNQGCYPVGMILQENSQKRTLTLSKVNLAEWIPDLRVHAEWKTIEAASCVISIP